MVMTFKPKKKKRRHYHTGFHHSPKGGTFKYRSQWECDVATFFDHDPLVKTYDYEKLIIPYISNIKTGKVRRYYPDFLVTYTDGSRKLIEVKRQDKISDPKVMKKSNAARVWCSNNNVEFEIWSNTAIKAIKLLNEQNKGSQTKSQATVPLTLGLIFPPLPQVSVF